MEHSKTVVPSVVTTDKIIGVKIRNATNEKLGDIKNLVIDKISGRVCYVTLNIGGFLGIGEKDIVVPWNALSYDTSNECFILNADKEKLKNSEPLKEGWNDWSNEKWGNTVHQQFGTQPYWQDKDKAVPYKE